MRRIHYSSLLAVLVFAAACQAGQGAPTVAAPTPIIVRLGSSLTRAPAASQASTLAPPVINAGSTATLAPTNAIPTAAAIGDGKAIQLESMVANLRDGEILFVAHVISGQSNIASAKVAWTFDASKQSGAKDVQIPPQTVGQSTVFQVSMPLDMLPQTESALTYRWQLTDGGGNTLTSQDGHFKLTEATRADQRDDLPVVDAAVKFESHFPDQAVFTVTLKPERPITNARFFITQNHGIIVQDFEAHVSTKDPGQPLAVSFSWNPTLSLQIPWQAFETWWVFTDELGHVFRTAHALNDYADNRRHRWQRTPTKYAVLYTYDQPAANVSALAAAADHSIEALQKEFDYKLLYQPHIVIYNSPDDFKEWSPPVLEGSFIGMASGAWGGAVIGVYHSIRFTGYSIIKHELTHVFQFQSIQQRLPQWFIEGSARYMEEVPEEDDEAVTRLICKQFGAPSLQIEVPYLSPNHQVSAWPYYVGMSFIKYLRATYGRDSFAKVYLALARNVDLPTALQTVTGKRFDQLDKEWQSWIVR